jgi:carboxypeptidase C (cathepsin A)
MTIRLKNNLTASSAGWRNFLHGSALETEAVEGVVRFPSFLNSSCIKRGLHVGKDRSYKFIGDSFYGFLKADAYYSTRGEVEALLESDYRFLFFSAQFDIVVNHVGISRFLRSLSWKRSKEYLEVERRIWRPKGGRTIGGYVKEVEGMTYLLIRNGGHMPCYEHSVWCLDMINRFTGKRSFSED